MDIKILIAVKLINKFDIFISSYLLINMYHFIEHLENPEKFTKKINEPNKTNKTNEQKNQSKQYGICHFQEQIGKK